MQTLVTLDGTDWATPVDPFTSATVRFVEGREAILACAPTLTALAARTGQSGAMHGLSFVLDHAYARRKIPRLACLIAENTAPEDALLGCTLFFEYTIGPWRTGLVATGDASGMRTLLGPPEDRARIACRLADALLERAHVVLTSYRQASAAAPDLPADLSGLWSMQTREIRDHLPLADSYDATLATLGKRTRTHLRYYRRRLEEQTGCTFFPDVRGLISAGELVSLNASSLDPVAQEIFALQFRSTAECEGGFVQGLRSRDGAWISLAGGWRQGSTSILQWQMNAAGLEKLSLGTAFRAFMLEHEVSIGIRRLYLHNGTPHSMQHAFPREYVVDLVARRRSLFAALIVRGIALLTKRKGRLASRGNFLVDALRVPDLAWHSRPEPRG